MFLHAHTHYFVYGFILFPTTMEGKQNIMKKNKNFAKNCKKLQKVKMSSITKTGEVVNYFNRQLAF